MGLETSKRGLFTQQSALYTTGHNISNANTLGYSRQRVNMEATAGHPGVGLGAGTMPGFLGTGVQAGSIQRIRDGFVDQQYRQETNKLGYWDSQSKAITQMEDVLNEPSAYGLQKSLSEFWQSMQDLSVNPENGGARAVAVNRGVAVADSFNYLNKSLTAIQTNLATEIKVSSADVNSILEQIANLNDQIVKVEPNGYLPNDLYDKRDMLIDELSGYFPVTLEYNPSGGRALANAEGAVTVSLKTENGPVKLVDGNEFAKLEADPNPLFDVANNVNKAAAGLTVFEIGGRTTTIGQADLLNVGKIKSLMDAFGTDDGTGNAKGLYPDMLAELDKLAAAFAKEFNKIHESGTDINGDKGLNFFINKNDPTAEITAENIYVNKDIMDKPALFAASDSANKEEGNGNNAKKLGAMQFTALINGSTIQTHYQAVIGQLGVDGQHSARILFNTMTLLGAVENRRASISSVSLDEEMTDMIRFQQAYNASARMITVVDETLDKIINGMGVVGR